MTTRLANVPIPEPISTGEEFAMAVTKLTKVIQGTICEKVLQLWPSPYSKRWWNKELGALKRTKNKLSSISYKYRELVDHPSHEEHRRI